MPRYYQLLFTALLFAGSCQQVQEQQSSDHDGTSLQQNPIQETFEREHASLPCLTVGDDQKLYLSWVSQNEDSSSFYYAQWQDEGWGEPHLISSGSDWFVNWADYPMIAVNKHGNLLAHYLVKSDTSPYAYNVTMRTSKDGVNWSTPFTPHKDGTPTEHGFVSMLPLPNGSFQSVWLDGRNTGGHGHADTQSAMTLRTAQVSVDGAVNQEMELDNRVCDCCQTTASMLGDEVVVVYRDRSEDEVRDMYFTRLAAETSSEPTALNQDQWQIAGCPVNGARSASNGKQVAVAWFTAANNQPQVKVKFLSSQDSMFSEAITIDKDNPLGRVDIDWVDATKVMVSWLSKSTQGAEIKIAELETKGKTASELAITNVRSISTSDSRSSGFPQLAVYDDQTYLAWTEVDSLGQTKIRSAILKNSPNQAQ